MLKITVGPMYAGKTSTLMTEFEACSDSKVIIDFNTNEETTCNMSVITNHDNISIPCIRSKFLYDTLNIYKKTGNFQISHDFFHINENMIDLYDIHDKVKFSRNIFINEAQFFPDLYKFVTDNFHKNIYLYGLDGDFKRQPIGQLLDLVPLCDTIIKLTATCMCGEKAIFTHRNSSEEEQYVPNASYMPCCRMCYYKKNKK